MWIPPEYIVNYVNIGYCHFKLLDRLASTEWIIKALEVYLNIKEVENKAEILGTYGKSETLVLESISDNDMPYPIEKLEIVPRIKINKERSDKLINSYWYSNEHHTECGNCTVCQKLSDINLTYPVILKNKAIENNNIWQRKITKLPFIIQLNKSETKRIEYK